MTITNRVILEQACSRPVRRYIVFWYMLSMDYTGKPSNCLMLNIKIFWGPKYNGMIGCWCFPGSMLYIMCSQRDRCRSGRRVSEEGERIHWAEVRPGKVFLAWFPHNIEGGALLGGILDSVHSKGDFFTIISDYSRCGKDFQGRLDPGFECFN